MAEQLFLSNERLSFHLSFIFVSFNRISHKLTFVRTGKADFLEIRITHLPSKDDNFLNQ